MKNISKIIESIVPYKFKFDKKNFGVLISDRLRTDHNFRSILSSIVINKNFNANVFSLSEKKTFNNETNDLFRLFDIKKLYGNIRIFFFNNVNIYFKAFKKIIFFYFKIFYKKNKLDWFVKNFKVLDILIGDGVYDDYLRYNHRYLNPTIFSFSFFYILYSGIYKILIIDKYTKINNIKFFISNQKTYSSIGNLMRRYGAKKNIITILNGANFIKFIDSYNDSLGTPYRIKDKLINITKKKISEKLVNKYYHDRFLNKTFGLYVDKKYLKRNYKTSNDKKTLDLIKKIKKKNFRSINLYAAHCFSDASNFCNGSIFRDYYDHFISTIKYLKKIENDKDFWIIKPHPARKNYDEVGIIEKALFKYNVSNVIICPKDVNNNILYKNVNNVVTSVSTIALEFSCSGKKPIITGEAPFYNKETCTLVKSKNDYFRTLKNINDYQNTMSKNQILKSKYILFLLDNLIVNNLPSSKILPVNTKYIKNSLSYLKEIHQNRIKNKLNTIFDEPFYEQLEKRIKIKLNNTHN